MRLRSIIAAILMLAPGAGAAQVQMAPLGPATALLIRDVVRQAEKDFTRMPQVRLTSAMRDICGGDGDADDFMRYCTTLNAIYVSANLYARLPDRDVAAYMIAHLYGHAVQVRHGQADLAAAAIRAEPQREAELRGMIEAQAECIAGVIHARSTGGGAFALAPFDGVHWGADPLAAEPMVSIGPEVREAWFLKGRRAGDVAVCTVGELTAERLVRAER